MKWEYKIVYVDAARWSSTGLPAEIGQEFDRWGDEGWELVKVEPLLRGGLFALGFGSATHTAALLAFFKRQKE